MKARRPLIGRENRANGSMSNLDQNELQGEKKNAQSVSIGTMYGHNATLAHTHTCTHARRTHTREGSHQLHLHSSSVLGVRRVLTHCTTRRPILATESVKNNRHARYAWEWVGLGWVGSRGGDSKNGSIWHWTSFPPAKTTYSSTLFTRSCRRLPALYSGLTQEEKGDQPAQLQTGVVQGRKGGSQLTRIGRTYVHQIDPREDEGRGICSSAHPLYEHSSVLVLGDRSYPNRAFRLPLQQSLVVGVKISLQLPLPPLPPLRIHGAVDHANKLLRQLLGRHGVHHFVDKPMISCRSMINVLVEDIVLMIEKVASNPRSRQTQWRSIWGCSRLFACSFTKEDNLRGRRSLFPSFDPRRERKTQNKMLHHGMWIHGSHSRADALCTCGCPVSTRAEPPSGCQYRRYFHSWCRADALSPIFMLP